jgi:hypothetical protein
MFPNSVFYDNIGVNPIPEPGALAIAVGATIPAVACRRR